MNLQSTINQAKRILTTPKTEWPVIATAPETVQSLYTNYIIALAAVLAAIHFVSVSLVGISIPILGRYREGILDGFGHALIHFGLILLSVYLLAWLIDTLAPLFGGRKNRVQALKTTAFPLAVTVVASLIGLLPWLGFLAALAGGIYSIYLIKLGLPHTMQCPENKAGRYTAVTFVLSFLGGLVIASVFGTVVGMGRGPFGSDSADGGFSSGSLGARIESLSQSLEKAIPNPPSDSAGDGNDKEASTDQETSTGTGGKAGLGGKLEQWAQQMDAASKQMEAAGRNGDSQAQVKAVENMLGTLLGGQGKVESLPVAKIKAFVPESLDGLKRTSLKGEKNAMMGVQVSTAKASYSDGENRNLQLEITDTGSLKGLVGFAQTWLDMKQESETDTGYQRTYRKDGRLIHEDWDNRDHRGEYGLIIGERFTIKLSGQAPSMEHLQSAMTSMDLAGLEQLKAEGTKASND